MRYIITKSGAVVFGPAEWSAGVFSRQISAHGVVASLPKTAPAQSLELGECTIHPVVDEREPVDTLVAVYGGEQVVQTADGWAWRTLSTPRPAADVRADLVKRVKSDAYSILRETDWYVVRRAETGDAVPQAVLTQRAEVRSRSDAAETEISGLADADVYTYDIGVVFDGV